MMLVRGLRSGVGVAGLLFAGEALAQDRIVLGLGAAIGPEYQGSDEYQVQPLPVIDIRQGRFFANFRNGIGLSVVDEKSIEIGGGVVFMPGYRGREVPDGVGRLTAGVGGRLFATARSGSLSFTLGGTQGFAGNTRGFIADGTIAYRMILSSKVMVTPAVSATWANAKHTDRYFGISEGQAIASGLPRYDAGAGFKDVSAGLSLGYRLTDRIGLGASGGVTHMLGDAADSPLVRRKTYPGGFLSLSYMIGKVRR